MKKLSLTIFFALSLPCAYCAAEESELRTRLIIHVDEPLKKEGGAVVVSGRQISDDEWRAIETEAGNKDGAEKEFHVRVSSPASVIDFVYPASGTYSFKFQSLPGDNSGALETKQILIGSAEVTDPETKQAVNWPSMSVIHVRGPTYDEAWARLLSSNFDLAFTSEDRTAVSIKRFPAGRVLSLSATAIQDYVRDTK